MPATSRSSRALVPFTCLALLMFLGLPIGASAQSGETIETFIQNAYSAVGLSPSCFTVQSEVSTLEGLLPTNSAGFEEEARRFVSTLIETQGSYDTHTNPPYFEETPAYSTRNAILSGNSQGFVTDLYYAFLQRTPDYNGLIFWIGRLDDYSNPAEGRREVLDSFGTIPSDAELTNLVHSLVDGGSVCCPIRCPRGYFFDTDICACTPI